jgi:hypothetical protein
MKSLQHINGTFVRHNWAEVAAGIAAGKTFLVENHGKPEALLVSPDQAVAPKAVWDANAYFERLKRKPKVSFDQVNAALARGSEL